MTIASQVITAAPGTSHRRLSLPLRRRPEPGDIARAAALYQAVAPCVLGYLRAQRAPDPENLLGEVFLQVVRDLPRFRGDDEALRPWVFSIARHRLVDGQRRQARRRAMADAPVPDVASPPPPEPFDPELVAALARLTSDQREVVVLRFVADLSSNAVAELTGRSVGAVKALQHRALDALAGLLPPRG